MHKTEKLPRVQMLEIMDLVGESGKEEEQWGFDYITACFEMIILLESRKEEQTVWGH